MFILYFILNIFQYLFNLFFIFYIIDINSIDNVSSIILIICMDIINNNKICRFKFVFSINYIFIIDILYNLMQKFYYVLL